MLVEIRTLYFLDDTHNQIKHQELSSFENEVALLKMISSANNNNFPKFISDNVEKKTIIVEIPSRRNITLKDYIKNPTMNKDDILNILRVAKETVQRFCNMCITTPIPSPSPIPIPSPNINGNPTEEQLYLRDALRRCIKIDDLVVIDPNTIGIIDLNYIYREPLDFGDLF